MQNESKEFSVKHFFRRNENIHIHMSNEAPNNANIRHSSDFFEIHYIISGEAEYDFNGQKYNATKGDLIFINKDTPFSYSEKFDNDESFLFYDLFFNSWILTNNPRPSFPYRLLDGSFAFYSIRDKEVNPFLFFTFSKNSYSMFGEFFNKMYMEYRRAKSGYNDVMMAYLTLIVINAIRLNENNGNSDEKIYRSQAIKYVQSYINRCYCDFGICVSGLADLVYLNPDYLGRIFKKDTGMTISEAIQAKRIERACFLLSTTDKPVSDIARESGFCDPNFFYKIFKRRMGTLPGQYRENTKH